MPAEPLAGDAGQAAQHRLAGEPARHRQVGAQAAYRRGEDEPLPLAQGDDAPGRDRLPLDARLQVRPAERQPRGPLGDEHEPAQRDLQRRRVPGVAQQAVGPGEGVQVGRPALGDAEPPGAEAPGILEHGQRPGPLDPQVPHLVPAHDAPSASGATGAVSPPRRSNSRRVMAVKRTRSPTASRLSPSRPRSNSRAGVRPSRFQPPGETRG